jgi:hypothetical protein
MNINFQAIKTPNRCLGSQDASPLALLSGWPRFFDMLRSQITLAVLAILITVSLMLLFHQVLLGAVAQGELRQQARDQQSEVFWRCNSMGATAERDNCLRQFNATARAEGSL